MLIALKLNRDTNIFLSLYFIKTTNYQGAAGDIGDHLRLILCALKHKDLRPTRTYMIRKTVWLTRANQCMTWLQLEDDRMTCMNPRKTPGQHSYCDWTDRLLEGTRSPRVIESGVKIIVRIPGDTKSYCEAVDRGIPSVGWMARETREISSGQSNGGLMNQQLRAMCLSPECFLFLKEILVTDFRSPPCHYRVTLYDDESICVILSYISQSEKTSVDCDDKINV